MKELGCINTGWGDLALENEAIELLRLAVQIEPGMPAAHARLAQVYSWVAFEPGRSDLVELATESIADALELAPRDPEVRMCEALYHQWARRDYARVLDIMTTVVELQPSNTYALVMVGSIQKRQGKWNDAQRTLERTVQLDPKDPNTIQALARGVYAKVGDHANAASAFERLI